MDSLHDRGLPAIKRHLQAAGVLGNPVGNAVQLGGSTKGGGAALAPGRHPGGGMSG